MKRALVVNELDHRQLGRDSLFLMVELRLEGSSEEYRVKVRNLSAGGMMAEGSVKVLRGTPLKVNLRNLGWVDGVVAWIQDSRFGIAFLEDIDPLEVRVPVSAQGPNETTPRFVRPVIQPLEEGKLRKI